MDQFFEFFSTKNSIFKKNSQINSIYFIFSNGYVVVENLNLVLGEQGIRFF